MRPFCGSSYFVVVAGANLVPREEKERVAVRINCLTQQDMEAGGFFWMDRDHAMVLATVQDRAHQVSRVLRQVKTSLASILHVMFPLDEAPWLLGTCWKSFVMCVMLGSWCGISWLLG